MIGVIFSNKDLTSGLNQLSKMISYWEYSSNIITRKNVTSYGVTIELNHKDIWRVIVPNDNVRGLRCNVALIDKNIPQEIVKTIIAPMATNPVWNAIGYY